MFDECEDAREPLRLYSDVWLEVGRWVGESSLAATLAWNGLGDSARENVSRKDPGLLINTETSSR